MQIQVGLCVRGNVWDQRCLPCAVFKAFTKNQVFPTSTPCPPESSLETQGAADKGNAWRAKFSNERRWGGSGFWTVPCVPPLLKIAQDKTHWRQKTPGVCRESGGSGWGRRSCVRTGPPGTRLLTSGTDPRQKGDAQRPALRQKESGSQGEGSTRGVCLRRGEQDLTTGDVTTSGLRGVSVPHSPPAPASHAP